VVFLRLQGSVWRRGIRINSLIITNVTITPFIFQIRNRTLQVLCCCSEILDVHFLSVTTTLCLKKVPNMPKVKWVMSCGLCSSVIRFPAVQKCWKLVKIWRSYREFKGRNLFSKYMWWLLTARYLSPGALTLTHKDARQHATHKLWTSIVADFSQRARQDGCRCRRIFLSWGWSMPRRREYR